MEISMYPLCLEGNGHVIRCASLAEKLIDEGHKIYFNCGEQKADLVRSLDVDTDHENFTLQTIVSLGDGISSELGDPFNWHTYETVKEFVSEEIDHIRSNDPDVVLSDMRPTVKVSSLLTDTPFASLIYAFYQNFTQKTDEMLEKVLPSTSMPVTARKMFKSALQQNVDPYNRVLSERDSSELLRGFYELFNGDLDLMPDMEELYEFTDPKPEHAHFVGPYLEELDSDPSLPDWLRKLQNGDKPIVFCCYGTVADRNMVETSIEYFRNKPFELVVTLGDLDSEEIESQADNVHVFEYIEEFDQLIHQSSLIIFHGGAETAYKCIRGEVPMIMAPELLEQVYMAHQLEKLGVGVQLDGGTMDTDDLKTATERLMSDDSVTNKLDELSSQLSSYNGLETSAKLLQDLEIESSQEV